MSKFRRIVLWDLDGTLFDDNWRVPMIPDWDAYYGGLKDDVPIIDLVRLCQVLRTAGYYNIGITGRPEKYRNPTLVKCMQHQIVLDELLMRADDDRRPSPEMKIATIEDKGIPFEDIAFIIDDHEGICAAFYAKGVVSLNVYGRRRTDAH